MIILHRFGHDPPPEGKDREGHTRGAKTILLIISLRFGPDPTPEGKDREGHTRGAITILFIISLRFGPDPTPEGKDREGHTRGAVQGQKPDGFTKSTAVHSYGPEIHTTATLRRLEPYVARYGINKKFDFVYTFFEYTFIYF